MAGNSGGDTFESLISLLVIIFFIFSGFFRKPKKPKMGKPIIPQGTNKSKIPPRRPQRHISKPIETQSKKFTPSDLKDFFEDILEERDERAKPKPLPPVTVELVEPAAKQVTITARPHIAEAVKEHHEKRKALRAKKRAAAIGRPVVPVKETPARRAATGLLFSRNAMQNAVIMSELLQKPLAMRSRRRGY